MAGLDDRAAAQVLAAGRVAIGLALIAVPGRIGRSWIGPEASGAGTRVFARSLGVRDVALGAGALMALRQGDPARRWIAMGAAADAVDFGATLAAPGIPVRGKVVTAAIAGAALAAGVRLAGALD
jgi:hypothetical protein